LDARLDLLPGASRALGQRARVRLHHGTAEIMARVVILEGEADSRAATAEGRDELSVNPMKRSGTQIEPGASGLVQFRLESPVTALPGDRFIIRSYSPQVTIGGGVILDSLPEKHRVRSSAPRLLEELERADQIERVAILVENAGPPGLSLGEILSRTGATDGQIAQARATLVGSGRVAEVPGSPTVLVSAQAIQDLSERVVSGLTLDLKCERLSVGLSREEVRERLFNGIRAEVFRTVIQRLVEAGKAAAEREALRLATHRPALGHAEAEAKQKFEN